jgi:hypothetical protein
MTATTPDELRTNLIGTRTLQCCEARSIDGSNMIYPLGDDADRIIMDITDGLHGGRRNGR